MPRSPTLLQPDFPYHIGARSINRDWFQIPMEHVWEIFSRQLYFIHHAFGVRIHAFVLMNNHFHLILSTPQSNISNAMAWFMRETSRELTRAGNRENQSYGGRYFRSMIGSHHYYLHAYKYVYSNPLRAGICERAEQYKFSSLYGLLGRSHLSFPVLEDATLFSDIEGTLAWINRPAPMDHWETVRRSLQRRQFKLPRPDRASHKLEFQML